MTTATPGTAIRVLTVNIHKGWTAWRGRYILEELRTAIRAVAGDLVLLQEVHGPREGLAGAQAEYLADTLWRDHAWGRNALVRGGAHGNAVLSRWPILRHVNHDITQPGDEPRGLLHCVLGLPGRELHAICVHLGLRESHRQRQLGRLCAIARNAVPAEAPLVVAGDFNDWRSRADPLLERSGLREVHRAARGTHARSFPASCPFLRLDRIYVARVSAHQPLPLPRRPWARLSDHAPLAAEVLL
ncbi:MAG: endonuclease/exonuclease/phosphatase family protein [Steroidobacteraceae bacterium]